MYLWVKKKEPGNSVTSGSRGKKNPQICPRGIREGSSKKVTLSIGQLKCLYANAYSMWNKQEELEAIVLLENYGLIAITEVW